MLLETNFALHMPELESTGKTDYEILHVFAQISGVRLMGNCF